MEIEERDFYKHVDTADDFFLCSVPEAQDLTLATLPDSYRVHGIEIDLPDGPRENLVLRYTQKQNGGAWKILQKDFNVLQHHWIDEEG
jgi:hypothetical protein